MNIRELPPEEWDRLKGHPALEGQAIPDPSSAVFFVAEDEKGEIVGVQGILAVIHLEPSWVEPDHRGSTTGFRLFKEAGVFLDHCRVGASICMTDQPLVGDYLERLGLLKLPHVTYLRTNQADKDS